MLLIIIYTQQTNKKKKLEQNKSFKEYKIMKIIVLAGGLSTERDVSLLPLPESVVH